MNSISPIFVAETGEMECNWFKSCRIEWLKTLGILDFSGIPVFLCINNNRVKYIKISKTKDSPACFCKSI